MDRNRCHRLELQGLHGAHKSLAMHPTTILAERADLEAGQEGEGRPKELNSLLTRKERGG